MNKFFITALIACALISCQTEKFEISKVVVYNSNFQKLRVIDQSDSINQLNDLWRDFEPINELPKTHWTYTLDIDSKKFSGRWLYNQEGYLAKLNKQLEPRFHIKNKKIFNKIILGF